MRCSLCTILTLSSCTVQLVVAFLNSLPEDAYALPKCSVTFLNNLPVPKETAQHWLDGHLQGGVLEFLNQPWKDEVAAHSRKGIDGGVNSDAEPTISPLPYHALEYMRLSPQDAYVCLIPIPLDIPEPPQDQQPLDATPMKSWSLLQPLAGTCLYHRQGWLTYSYCHNHQVRQFRELPHAHPHPSGYEPEEDPEWDAYTLGKAPPTPEFGADLTVAQRNALAANIELARGAGSRYLVQRWTDGSYCDKTGKRREVEIQFHCSPTMTDHILLVKEPKTCFYVVVVGTPRLCGQPGFRSQLDSAETAVIRCREIVDSVGDQTASAATALLETSYPVRHPRSQANSIPPNPLLEEQHAEETSASERRAGKYEEMLRTLSLLASGGVVPDMQAHIQIDEDGEIFVEIVGELPFDRPRRGFDGGGNRGDEANHPRAGLDPDVIADALRAAGYDVKGRKSSMRKEQKGGDAPMGEQTGAERERPLNAASQEHRTVKGAPEEEKGVNAVPEGKGQSVVAVSEEEQARKRTKQTKDQSSGTTIRQDEL